MNSMAEKEEEEIHTVPVAAAVAGWLAFVEEKLMRKDTPLVENRVT